LYPRHVQIYKANFTVIKKPMKLIGKGWQYRVYDIGGGRVRKIKRTPIDSFCRIFFMPKVVEKNRKMRFNPVLSYREMRRISRESDENMQQFKEILPSMPAYLTGNIRLLDGINYEQDYAIPLLQYFEEHNDSENKKILTQYVQLILELWQYGCSDKIFNFATNSGIDSQNRVIQIDVGELDFEREAVAERVQNKEWLSRASYIYSTDGMKRFFADEMNAYVTLENLDKYWKSKLTGKK
jgi:hypothetical protein